MNMFATMIRPLLKNKKFIIGISIFLFFLMLGILGPVLYKVSPTKMTWNYEQPLPPSTHWVQIRTVGTSWHNFSTVFDPLFTLVFSRRSFR